MSIDVTPINNNSNAIDNAATSTDNPKSIVFGYGFDGTNWDRIRVSSAFADATTNSTPAQTTGAFSLAFNGTTWDRMRTATADALAATGIQAKGTMLFNGSTWDRARTIGIGDVTAPTGIGAAGLYAYTGVGSTYQRVRTAYADAISETGLLGAGNMGFNGTTWDRLRVANAYSLADGSSLNFTGFLNSINVPLIWNPDAGAFSKQAAPTADTLSASRIASSGLVAFNGTQWERVRTVNGVADGATTGLLGGGQYGWNGAGWDRQRLNSVHKYQEYLSLTTGQHLEIWTPAAGKKFRLMNVLFSSNYATGARVTLRDAVAGTTAGAANLATFNFNAKDTASFQFGPNGYLSYQANNRLAVFNDSGATVSVWLTFIGTEE